jgi:acyl-CoA synthetase (AMP-forming)/AMP-acid ligase II
MQKTPLYGRTLSAPIQTVTLSNAADSRIVCVIIAEKIQGENTMKGLMQDWPLLTHRLLDHAAQWHGEREIISRTVEGPIHRETYVDLNRRSRQLAHAAKKQLGIKHGDIIGTMAWNGYRHMEIWYGVMGLGAIVHTLNPRLFPDQLTYIVNHAEDQWIFTDLSFVPIFERIADKLPKVKGYIVMTDAAHMPNTTLKNVHCYEDLLTSGDTAFAFEDFDENTACGLCYTSGTTGNPKGVLYSHRSNVLHAMAAVAADSLALTSRDTVLPVVPMFHANTWSLAHSCPMVGANMVMPGPKLDGASVCELLLQEKVTFSAAVPTIWFMLLQYLEANPAIKLPALDRVAIGGSACPEALMRAFKEKYDVDVIHAWGMTETSPLASMCKPKGSQSLEGDAMWKQRVKQGRPVFGVQMKLADDDGGAVAQDGKAFGRLKVKGPWVSKAYYKGDGQNAYDAEGWFDTGDVSTIDDMGFMQITDRSKDVIKSGGEWISSIELENVAMGCAGVAEAAAIGLPHPKWDERPLLVVVKKAGADVTKEQVLNHLTGKVAKWWMPDDIAFAEDIPHTATGKISKLQLRERFKDYRLPGVE